MRAIVCTKWGSPDVLKLKEVKTPVPKPTEVLVKIFATSVFAGDCEMRSLKFPLLLRLLMRIGFGFRGPRKKILGQELAGEIESVGQEVKLFKKGDQVFAATGLGFGAYAEYTCLSEQGVLAIKPVNMTYEEAVTIPVGGLNALHFLEKGNIQNGQKVLINGAGGSIGTIAVQLAKSYGAEVTCVDSTEKLDMLRAIGADHVIDYTLEDFASSERRDNGEIYDVIFDVVGKRSVLDCIGSLKEQGVYLFGNGMLSPNNRRRWKTTAGSRKLIGGTADYKAEQLISLRELIEAGKIKSVIDRRYTLEQMPEAHRYVDTGQKKGNVVVIVAQNEKT